MRRPVLLLVAMVAAVAVACSNDAPDKPDAAPAGGTAGPGAATAKPADGQQVAKIPILPGYKYYAGGPVMKRDKYGKYRLQEFNGEVAQPSSRGMVFGAKREGDKLEYRVWANGRIVALHRGTMRDGLFWQDYAESYRDEKLIAREKNVHDDATQRTKVTTEDIDPENGEVIRTKEGSLSYKPPALKNEAEDLDEDEDEEEEDAATAPPPAAPAPVPAPAPAPPAGDAAK